MSVASPVAAPLAAQPLLVFLLQVALLLLLATCLGRLSLRLCMPAVVGELLTGVLLGPSVLGSSVPALTGWLLPTSADQAHLLDAVGQLGVMLLVGIAGAHVDTRMMRQRRATVLRVALASLLVPLGLGIAAGFVVPDTLHGPNSTPVAFALFLGVAMCVSAIPVIAKTLSDMRMLHRDIGQLTLASATLADAVGWLMLSVVSVLAVSGVRPGLIGLSLLSLIGFVLAAAVVGRPVVRFALRTAARAPEPGPTVATAVVLVLLGAAASHALGLEPVFGAFVAGVLIGLPGMVEPARLAPLRVVTFSVLAPVFLASAGLRMDLTMLRDGSTLAIAAAVCLLAIAGKLAGAYAGARMSGLSRWEGLALGAGLNARGVVEVVVASAGLRLGVLSTVAYTIVVLVAVLTSVMAPPLLRWSMRRVELNAQERLREAELAAWSGPEQPDPQRTNPSSAGA